MIKSLISVRWYGCRGKVFGEKQKRGAENGKEDRKKTRQREGVGIYEKRKKQICVREGWKKSWWQEERWRGKHYAKTAKGKRWWINWTDLNFYVNGKGWVTSSWGESWVSFRNVAFFEWNLDNYIISSASIEEICLWFKWGKGLYWDVEQNSGVSTYGYESYY